MVSPDFPPDEGDKNDKANGVTHTDLKNYPLFHQFVSRLASFVAINDVVLLACALLALFRQARQPPPWPLQQQHHSD